MGGIYPFMAEAGLPPRGPVMGRCLDGSGVLCLDPWELYEQGVLTGLNSILLGRIGLGKSSFMKTFAYRELPFGRFLRVLDPKGEYDKLAEACGTEPIRLEPAGTMRLNPLDHRLLRTNEVTGAKLFQDQLSLLAAVVEAAMGANRLLNLEQRGALEVAFRRARELAVGREATIPDVVGALMEPTDRMAQALGMNLQELRLAAREPALALRRVVESDLAGMFDGPTSPSIQLDHPLIVLNLREVYGTAAQAVVMACAGAWVQQLLLQRPDVRQIWIVDEGWALLRDLSTARWMQEAFKFSRLFGLSCWLVLHQFSDLKVAGGPESEQAAIGHTLLSHAETKVIYGQDSTEIERTRNLLQLSDREAAVIRSLRKGQALVRVGDHRFRMEHLMTEFELDLTYTDEAMTA
jgi:type IV secretory pathway VirB4 component